jgi:hypothetical protein
MEMRMRFAIALFALLVFAQPLSTTSALADSGPAADSAPSAVHKPLSELQPCPVSADRQLNLAEGAQADCCKGHKGVCGCRAGKIVCCDNTKSPDCACHSDSGVAD